MPIKAKTYVGCIIGLGAALLVYALLHIQIADPKVFGIYLILAIAASPLKLRLPGMDGTYSPGFLFTLFGLRYLDPGQTILAGCAAVLFQSLANTKKRPTAAQAAFNMANVAVSVAMCFLAVRIGMPGPYRFAPAVLSVGAFVYFLTNTVLVSGVLALLQKKSLPGIQTQWYVWSLPYYLIGAGLVGILPERGYAIPPEALLLLFPVVYLIHFYLALQKQAEVCGEPVGTEPSSLPGAARFYAGAVIAAGGLLGFWSALHWHSSDATRFCVLLSLGLIGSTLKISLPRLAGTMSIGFILVLVAISELSLSETIALGLACGAIQSLWRAKTATNLVQASFASASLAISAALAFAVCHVLLPAALSGSVPVVVAVGTVVYYGMNTGIVSIILALAASRGLGTMWKSCYFWSFPYYLIGAAFAGLAIFAGRSFGWTQSALLLPMMLLVYASYRIHLDRAAGPLAVEQALAR